MPVSRTIATSKIAYPTRGMRILLTGHSFHVFIDEILAHIARDIGMDGQQIVASKIGGSTVLRHWDVPDSQNTAKSALVSGQIDVMTMSPIWLPDEGIEKFSRLGLAHNPHMRFTVQEYWLPNDEYEPVYPLRTDKKVDHDATNMADLRRAHDRYFHDMDQCISDINARLEKRAVYVAPVGQAVLALREKVVAGQVPGVREQSALFTDSWGHPTAPIKMLAAYCHYAAIYQRSPIGLPVPEELSTSKDDTQTMSRLLQELAWKAVVHHPLSGMEDPDRSASRQARQ